jgi:hypothetical protein
MTLMRMNHAIPVAMKLDEVARSIRPNKVNVVLGVMHTTKASYQVAYHLEAETILRVIQRHDKFFSFFR